MRAKTLMLGVLIGLAVIQWAAAARAGSDLDEALAKGAERLAADEIARRLAGKTVTFVSAAGEKKFLIYYGEGNEAAGKMIGGDWADTGFYGVADNDTICLSWTNSDKPRLRCIHVLLVDGVMQKFQADGSLGGAIVKVEDGKSF